MRFNADIRVLRKQLVLVVLATLGACQLVPGAASPDDGWAMEPLPAEIPPGGSANPSLDQRESDPGHYLYLAVSSAKLDYGSTDAFFESLYKHPFENSKGVGHCWIVLESPEGRRSFGHTGEYGKERPTYVAGVRGLMSDGDPNPVRYLWEEMPDGELLHGDGGTRMTFCCRVPVTEEEIATLLAFANEFDYDTFALRGKGCSDYVTAAARLASVHVPNRLRLHLPRTLLVWGNEELLWTDPRYSTIVFGSPELFEAGLRELVARGIAEEVDHPY